MNGAPGLDGRGLPAGYPFKPDWETTPREVAAAMKAGKVGIDGDIVLLDCRRQEEWDAARIEGAVLIPMDQTEQRAEELEDDAGSRERPVVVYCHTGRRSLRVASALRAMGFADVKSMAGGIELWSIDIDPSVPRY